MCFWFFHDWRKIEDLLHYETIGWSRYDDPMVSEVCQRCKARRVRYLRFPFIIVRLW